MLKVKNLVLLFHKPTNILLFQCIIYFLNEKDYSKIYFKKVNSRTYLETKVINILVIKKPAKFHNSRSIILSKNQFTYRLFI